MKAILALAASLCFICPAIAAEGEQLYIVEVVNNSGRLTGFVVGQSVKNGREGTLIMTSAHGVKLGEWNTIRWNLKTQNDSQGWTTLIDKSRDLALIRIEDTWPDVEWPAILPANQPIPKAGDRIINHGVQGTQLIKRRSTVKGSFDYKNAELNTTLVRIDQDANPGDSGGPVMMDKFVVGVQLGILRDGTNDEVFVPHTAIWQFINANRAAFENDKPKINAARRTR